MDELGQEYDQDIAGEHLRVVIVRFPQLLPRGDSEATSLTSPTNLDFEGGSSSGRQTVVYWTRSILYSQEFNVEVVEWVGIVGDHTAGGLLQAIKFCA
jgi:hypothetical protein